MASLTTEKENLQKKLTKVLKAEKEACKNCDSLRIQLNMMTTQVLIFAANSQTASSSSSNFAIHTLPLPPVPLSKSVEADSSFDFCGNPVFTVEKIVRSTFANPDRKKFPESLFGGKKFPLYHDTIKCEELLQRISSEIPYAMMGFNFAKIYLRDTDRLLNSIDKSKWLSEIKKLSWYGPFFNGTDIFKFQTADSSGNFYGFHFEVFLNKQMDIFLNLLWLDNSPAGIKHTFGKTAETLKQKEKLLADSSSGKLVPAPISQDFEGDSKFDFAKKTTITLEKIIRSTFANPDRKKFPESSFESEKFPLCPESITCEDIIQKISKELPVQMKKMNNFEIDSYSTQFLDADVDKALWLQEMKKLSWYGPFSKGPQVFKFQTADKAGKFFGYHFEVCLDIRQQLILNFVKFDNSKNTKRYCFEL